MSDSEKSWYKFSLKLTRNRQEEIVIRVRFVSSEVKVTERSFKWKTKLIAVRKVAEINNKYKRCIILLCVLSAHCSFSFNHQENNSFWINHAQ